MEDVVHQPKSEALRALFWRSEILQVMYWLKGERLGAGDKRDQADAELLERFLGVEADVIVRYLDRLVDEGYLVTVEGRYALSAMGQEEGKLEFASSFSDLQRPTHGECSADCWCHSSPEEAEACAAERAAHQH